MQLTPEKVAEVSARAEGALADFAADPQNVHALHEALGMLQWLREEYLGNREAFASHLPRLKELRERLTGSVRVAQAALAAEYIRAGREAAAWKQRQGDCRDLLVELASIDRVERFDSPEGRLEVRRARTAALPPADSAEREELYALLKEAGRWADVSVVNPTRLTKAIDGGLFTAEQVGRLARLCPVRVSTRLATPRGGM